MKKVAISQSNYIPWKGYFDLINSVDEFVIYDEMQYTKRDWRNRNIIKTSNGLKWLTIPVEVKGKYFQKINEVIAIDDSWRKKHWNTIKHNYARARYFKQYEEYFESLYLDSAEKELSKINYNFIKAINEILKIDTKMIHSKELTLAGDKSEKLLNICMDLNATVYVSGPAAKNYLDERIFNNANIKVEWMKYDNYKEYEQLYGEFSHNVSILDLIFAKGEEARYFLNKD